MNSINNFLSKFFGNKSQRDMKLLLPYIAKIKAIYPEIEALSNDELRKRSELMKNKIRTSALEVEQEIPVYNPQKYYWAWTSIETPNPENYRPFTIISGYTNIGIWIDGVETPIKKISMRPPTEKEYQDQENRVFVYTYRIQRTAFPFFSTTIRLVITYVPQIIQY